MVRAGITGSRHCRVLFDRGVRVLLFLNLLCVWSLQNLAVTFSQDLDRNAVADGELHDIQILSLDRMVAVGDRGLILGTENAGKTWSVRNSRSEFSLYGVCFTSEAIGCAVGGTIDPFTHRSRGVALTTEDGGKTWVRSQSHLPRLIGVTVERSSRLIAWGDWSTVDQTSIFQSMDNGLTWSPIPSPCGHIETIGVERSPVGLGTEERMRFDISGDRRIVIDRLSRCFFSQDGANYELVPIPGVSSGEPIRSVCHSGSTWWMCGDNGLLLSSGDGKQWLQHFLPGGQADWDLLSLKKIYARGDDVWISGNPGTVIWHSSDAGATWSILPTGSHVVANSLAILDKSVIAYCGSMTTINVSRNNGEAWRLAHQSTSRLSTLNIASSADRIAWDLLAMISKDARQAAGFLVVHDQNLEQRSAYRPEQSARSSVAGKRVEFATVETLAGFPISDSSSQPRWTDFGHYSQSGTLLQAPSTPLFRKLVQAIRNSKPDLLVTECSISGSELEKKLAQSVELAITWASRRDYSLFSEESRIPNEHWTVQRTLYRGDLRTGRQFHPSAILKNVGVVLGEVIGPALAIAYHPEDSSLSRHSRMRYRSGTNAPESLLNPLDGLPVDRQTALKEKIYGASQAGLLVSTANWFNSGLLLKHQVANPLIRDVGWESKLSQTARIIESESRGLMLIDIAREARRAGHWNMWSSTLEYLIANDSKSAYAEYAQLELMRFTGSAEVNQMLAKQLRPSEHQPDDEVLVSTSLAVQTSPFAQEVDTAVKPASYAYKPRRIPIATDAGLPEFHRLLSNLPDAWSAYRFDPEWGWLIASRFRQYQASKSEQSLLEPYQLQVHSANFFPRLSDNLLNWQMVQSQEYQLTRQVEFTRNAGGKTIPELTKTSDRPFLDGEPNEELWKTAFRFELKDPWGELGETIISITRDEEFLYLLSQSIEAAPVTKGALSSNRKRDSLTDGQESIRLRLDIDRDYSTWFEFGWSDSGEMIDACNDMLQWNPNWYVASKPTTHGWNAEIAIPIAEIASTDNPISPILTHVGINVIHSIPGRGARVMAPAVSDRFQADQWTITKW